MLRRLETALQVLGTASATTGAIKALPMGGSCAPMDARSDRLVESFKAFVGKTDMGGTVEKTTMGLADVTRLGSSYAVEDTKIVQAGFETASIFDSKWEYVEVRQISK